MTISTTRPALVEIGPADLDPLEDVPAHSHEHTLGAFLALTAQLSDRVDARSLRKALVQLSDSPDPRLAIAAHATALLVDGFPISRRLLEDLMSVVQEHVTAGPWHRDSRDGAVALVAELGAAITIGFTPAALEAVL